MRYILSGVGVLVSLALIVVSAGMNYKFLSLQGQTEFEAQIYGGASVALDILKTLLPFFGYWAYREGRYLVAGLSGIIFMGLTAFSLTSGVGFAASNRTGVIGDKETLVAKYLSAQNQLKDIEGKIVIAGDTGVSSTIREEISKVKQHKRWKSTKKCSDATLDESRDFCTKYYDLRSKLASAIEGERLFKSKQNLQVLITKYIDAGAQKDTDPQVSILAKITSIERDNVKLAMILAIAVLVEAGSGLGLFLSTNHGNIGRKDEEIVKMAVDNVEVVYGDFEKFGLSELNHDPENYISLMELYGAYSNWCNEKKIYAYELSDIRKELEYWVQETEIEIDNDGYIGLSLAA